MLPYDPETGMGTAGRASRTVRSLFTDPGEVWCADGQSVAKCEAFAFRGLMSTTWTLWRRLTSDRERVEKIADDLPSREAVAEWMARRVA